MRTIERVVNVVGDGLLWLIGQLLRLHRHVRKRGKNINGFHP